MRIYAAMTAGTIFRRASACLVAALFFFGFSTALPAEPPFAPGEKLTFELRWGVIPAGQAVLEVYPMTVTGAERSFHFVLSARSNAFVDIFYKVRDRIDAYADATMNHTLFYRKKQHEGSHRRDETVKFDWRRKTAHYTNFGKSQKPVGLPAGTFDPLSAFYYTRLLDLTENMQVRRPVTDGKKVVIGKARIVKREALTIKGRAYDTFLIEPEIKDIGGVFKESTGARIQVWVTADARHLPVRVKSKVVVGSFIGDLIAIEDASP